MDQETRSTFHDDIQQLTVELAAIAKLVPADLRIAADALLSAETAADDVAIRDVEVDARSGALESAAKSLLALQQPVAIDLRTILAVLRLATELDRSARLVAHVAQVAERRDGTKLPPALRDQIAEVADHTVDIYDLAVDAFSARDADRARLVEPLDDTVDAAVDRLYQVVQDELAGPPVDTRLVMDMGLVARYFERIGDHAVTIADQTLYLLGEQSEAPA